MRRSPSAVRREPAPESRAAKKTAPTIEEVAKIPHDVINEQVIIAACIVDLPTRARLTKALPADGFYGKGHKAAWEMLRELEKRGLAYDPATVRSIAPDVDTNYLDALVASRPELPDNLAYHVEAFHWDRRRVEAARGPVAELVEALQITTTDPDKIRRLSRRVGNAFDGSSTLRFLRDPESVLAELEKDLDESVERRKRGRVVDHPYGLDGFDVFADGSPRVVPGVEPKGMTLFVGESGHGKTTLINQIVLAQNAQGKRVLHGAWEADAKTNLRLLAGFSLGIPRSRLRTGLISDEERDAVKREARRLIADPDRPMIRFFELPFSMRGNKERNLRVLNDEHLDIIHEHVEFSGCDVAIYDLFHEALETTDPGEEKYALKRMKKIGQETGAHQVLVHHLNKEDLNARADRRPTRRAIKGGTHWINAPDTIIAPHIPGKVKHVPMDTLEIHILKQRDGDWPIAVEFDYDPTTGVVTNGRSLDMSTIDDAPEGSFAAWAAGESGGGKKGKGRGR